MTNATRETEKPGKAPCIAPIHVLAHVTSHTLSCQVNLHVAPGSPTHAIRSTSTLPAKIAFIHSPTALNLRLGRSHSAIAFPSGITNLDHLNGNGFCPVKNLPSTLDTRPKPRLDFVT